MPNKRRKRQNELPVLHPDAAGVDIGAEEIFVAGEANQRRKDPLHPNTPGTESGSAGFAPGRQFTSPRGQLPRPLLSSYESKNRQAASRHLARIIFHLLTNKEEYNDSIFSDAEKDTSVRMTARLRKQAAALGFQLLPAASAKG